MKLINHEQIMSLNISQKQGYEWIKESFLTKKDCQLPPKISMVEEGHVFYNVMPSLNHNHMIGGIKMVTRLPGRNPSLNSEIFLYNMEDAKLKAILDGNYITAFRTAAVAALAIDTFAKKDFNTIAIMGLGVTASAIMNMLSYTLKDKNINIDEVSSIFGNIMGEVFVYKKDENERNLRMIGFNIGKYIYLLDAYEDLDEDFKKGRYNPFIEYIDKNDELKEKVKKIIVTSLGFLARGIDNLNLNKNVGIIENIIYSGVYLRYINILESRGGKNVQ